MDKIICFSCYKPFTNVNNLIRHLRIRHANIPRLTCCYHNCYRKYSRLDSYKFHLNSHFNNDNNQLAISTQNIISNTAESNDQPCTSELAISNLNTNSNTAVSNGQLCTTESDIQLSVTSSSTLVDTDIRLSLIKEIIKAYCNELIPRNKTIEIIQNILNVFRRYLLILKDKLSDCNAISDIQNFFEKMCDSTMLESEYKFIKELKKTNFFVDVNYISLHKEFQEVLIAGGQTILKNIDYSIALLSLRTMFKILFQKNSIFKRSYFLY
ncbi:hypothetical protein CVS40_12960 [Lucilia cuprina]|nr:hypothetical protein CVS40_12960 [Lucilia cuprina]